MGIPNLTSFIDEYAIILKNFKLHNTRVIIDGNNLCHCLYFDSGVSCLFGGDYDRFYKRAKDYFSVYSECNITPLVLFDGAYDYSERKLKTVRKRALRRLGIVTAQARQKNVSVGRVLPIMGLEVLQDLLRDMEITFVQCDFEADNEIAALSNYLQCPVLSLDSDFFIFDLQAGFIPLNLIDTNVQYEEVDGEVLKYLSCRIYKLDVFVHMFRLSDREVLPLFSILMGNDFVEAETFAYFFKRLKISTYNKKIRHEKMYSLLRWLHMREKKTAIEEVVASCKRKYRQSKRDVIEANMDNYVIKPPTVLDMLKLDENGETKEIRHLKTMHDEILPESFRHLFNSGVYPPFFFNAVGQRRVTFSPQIEEPKSPSSYQVSRPLRQVIYGLLFVTLKLENGEKFVKNVKVAEYDRVCDHLANVFVKPTNELPNFGNVPRFDEVDNKSGVEILCETLQMDERVNLNLIPQNLHLIFLITRFWVVNSIPKVTSSQYEVFLLCVLKLSVFKKKSKMKKQLTFPQPPPEASLTELIDSISKQDATNAMHKLNKYRLKPQLTSCRHFDVSVVHNFTQLQTCLLYANYLNRLLNFPFYHLRVDKLFNGTFLYNFCLAVEEYLSTQELVEKLLGVESVCMKSFVELNRIFKEFLPVEEEESSNEESQGKIRRINKKEKLKNCQSKKNKKMVKKAKEKVKIVKEEVDRAENSSEKYEIQVDTNNRYSMLSEI